MLQLFKEMKEYSSSNKNRIIWKETDKQVDIT